MSASRDAAASNRPTALHDLGKRGSAAHMAQCLFNKISESFMEALAAGCPGQENHSCFPGSVFPAFGEQIRERLRF